MCIPTFNRGERLRASLDSVLLGQSFEDLHVVVYDNASQDETARIVGDHGDPRVHYVRRPVNVGPVANANDALARVTSEYVLLLHDDDVVSPGFVGAAVAALDSRPHAALAFGPWWLIRLGSPAVLANPTGLQSSRDLPGADLVTMSMASLGAVTHVSGTLFRTAAVPSPAFDPRDGYADDQGLLIRIGLEHDAVFLSPPAATVTVAEDSMSARGGRVLVGERELRDMKLRILETVPAERAGAVRWRDDVQRMYRRRVMWHAGATLRRTGSPRAALGILGEGFAEDRRLLTDARAWRTGVAGALSPTIAGPAAKAWQRTRSRRRSPNLARTSSRHEVLTTCN